MAKLYVDKNCPQLGIQLPNTDYVNQKFHLLMVIFNQIERPQIPNYILDSITLFYGTVSISMALRGCDMYNTISDRPSLWKIIIESYLNKVREYATSTSTSTPTLFKLLLMSQFTRETLPHIESTQRASFI